MNASEESVLSRCQRAIAHKSPEYGWLNPIHIDKGWSNDVKYRVTDSGGRDLIVRISNAESFSRKQQEFDVINSLESAGSLFPKALDVGIWPTEDLAYLVLTWVPGREAEAELPELPQNEQYRIGVEAGKALKKIHSLPVDGVHEDWLKRYSRKIETVFELHISCSEKLEYAEDLKAFLDRNVEWLGGRSVTWQHGDYHAGNFILSDDNDLRVIDFNRCSIGDPWEEYDRIAWTWRCSGSFATGQIDGYFDGEIPDGFFEAIAVYAATNVLASVPWVIPFGSEQIEGMKRYCDSVYAAYNGFASYVPRWYSGT